MSNKCECNSKEWWTRQRWTFTDPRVKASQVPVIEDWQREVTRNNLHDFDAEDKMALTMVKQS